MAVCLDAQGNYKEAISKYSLALALLTKKLGPDHPKCANIHLNMAVSLLFQRDKSTAKVHLQAAQHAYKQLYGEKHPDFLECVAMLKRCSG
jgi:hypothetical protein